MNKEDIELKLKSIISSIDSPVVKEEDEDENLSKRDKFVNDLKGATETKKTNNFKELNLEKMDFVAPTDEEIEVKAEDSISKKYDAKKELLDDNLQNTIDGLESKKQSEISNLEDEKKDIEKSYNLAKEEVSNQAIKRGIARSSIILEKIGGLDASKIQDFLEVDSESANKLASINDEINNAENDYKNAVKELDLNKALEKQEKIESLKKEREDKLEEVLKYNNSIEEKLVKYYNDNIDEYNSKTNYSQDDAVRKERYLKALNYYYSLNATDALQEFENDSEVQSLLGEKYSDMLEKYLKNWQNMKG